MRNAEVIRQWRILKTIEAGRHTSTGALAKEHEVTDRTIRRDIEALQEAGFPLYDEWRNGRKIWRLVEGYKQKLTQSFTLAELAALYFGRTLMSFLGGAPFAQDLESVFAKIRDNHAVLRRQKKPPRHRPRPLCLRHRPEERVRNGATARDERASMFNSKQ